MDRNEKIPLLVGLAIPVLMILFISGSIYLPRLLNKTQPHVDFLFSSGGLHSLEYFSVQEGRLVRTDVKSRGSGVSSRPVQLYRYDVGKNQVISLSTQAAQNLYLNANPVSSDGYEIISGSYPDGIFPLLFSSYSDYGSIYIKGHGVSRKINVPKQNIWETNFHFIGWIER